MSGVLIVIAIFSTAGLLYCVFWISWIWEILKELSKRIAVLEDSINNPDRR